ncbi:hypothetical protein AAE478_007971 [Parahypoxylon ruwenzoriense]
MLSKSVVSTLLALASARTAQSIPLESPDAPVNISRRWLPSADKIRGVNLGSQFIIEPWMAYDEWASMGCGNANDEWKCVEALGQDAADAAFQKHWDTWTTKDDINQIKSLGLNTVRIPVGFWLREDLVKDGEHYPRGGLKYLDRLVGWCREAGIYVIMDLHGGPGVQYPNQQFTGHGVSYPGFYTQENYERAYKFLEWMTQRIHTNENYFNVGMLQVMNEPVHAGDYPDLAADMVANYYPGAWTRIRNQEKQLGVKDSDLLHIQMMGNAWGSGDPTSHLPDRNFAFYDDHRYYKWDGSVKTTKDGYISAACRDNRGGSDIIVGEWSLSVADSVQFNDEFQIKDRPDQVGWYRKYWAAQAQAFEKSGGWVFWTWKCNWITGFNEWRWCYQSAVAAGAIPRDAASASPRKMCRRTIIHRMHHDVRTPIIIDAVAPTPTVFAHPRRTQFHRCELSLPVPGHVSLDGFPCCEYHSCCIPTQEIEHCDSAPKTRVLKVLRGKAGKKRRYAYYDVKQEPETCPHFVLEHRHERLEYLGEPDAYPQDYPATWREDVHELERDWFSWFAHSEDYRIRWEDGFFDRCALLHTLQTDAEVRAGNVYDLSQYWPPWDPARTRAGSELLWLEARLNTQPREHAGNQWVNRGDPEWYR